MVRHILAGALAVAALTGSAIAQKCTRNSKCPSDTPCCGLYGDCGVGAFCLGGCDPTMSTDLDSCVPNPICKSGQYKLTSLDDVQTIDKYLGDNSKINWQSQGTPVQYNQNGGGLLLTMAEGTSGTLLASTFYVWYGKICAKMSTSQGQGVVTAFIMMSDVKDEIDFEFVGTDINNAQTNYYSQGITDYNNMEKLGSQNTVATVHEYCVDWTEDQLTWSVDGDTSRTIKRSDTWNATANHFDYPQTPSRIMLSLWPAGLPSNGKGTIEWAGGEIDWSSEYMQNGYYYALVKEVNVDCYDAPAGTKKDGSKSYKYTDSAATNNTIEISNDLVVLGSLMDTGDEPGDASKTASSVRPTKSVNMVPGGNPGGGNRQDTPVAEGSASVTPGATATSEVGTEGSSNGGSTQWSQGNNQNAGPTLQPDLTRTGGSVLAIVVAILGLIAL